MEAPGQPLEGPRASQPAAQRDGHSPDRAPTRCVWCGAPLDGSARHLAGRTRCATCGVATTDPWPGAESLERAYARYRPESGRFSGVGDAVLRRTRARLARRVDRLAPAGRVLDVGAGDGTLIDALRARGREVLGLERDARHEAVREGTVFDVEGSWSAIVFWHSLEHLPAPRADLDEAAAKLEPGGALLVAVPNTESLQARLFGDRWLHLDLPRHLAHIPASALVERLGSLGLDVTRVSHWRGGQIVFGWLHGVVGWLPGRPSLYDAIRAPDARSEPITSVERAVALGVATLLLGPALLASGVEIAMRRGGTVYVEAHG